jgi:hypothetical protein
MRFGRRNLFNVRAESEFAEVGKLVKQREPRTIVKRFLFMTTKTKKSRKNVANPRRIRDESATNPRRIRYAFAPILQQFREHTRKNEARLWIPIETSLLTRYEFAALSPQTRYAFVAILLYCGANGIDEIPLDSKFMSKVLIIDERTLRKSFDELLFAKLLQERKEREIRKEQTDRQESVSVISENLSRNGSENKESFLKEDSTISNANGNSKHSQFTIEECLRYVEAEITKGATINNPKALARNLFNSGEADSFIRAALYPEQQKEIELKQFGEPTAFTDLPCSVCFGAKMADADGKGYRPCEHCRNERGKPTGYKPEEIKGES